MRGTARTLSLRLGEELLEAAVGRAQTFLSEHHGLLLPDRIADQSSFMEPTHGVPINVLPCADSIVKREIKNGKDRFVDLCDVDVHDQLRDLSGPNAKAERTRPARAASRSKILLKPDVSRRLGS
jgi:hypothetical protein